MQDNNGGKGLSIKEPFFTREDVPPVLESNKYWLLNVLRDDLTWLCPVEREGLRETSLSIAEGTDNRQ